MNLKNRLNVFFLGMLKIKISFFFKLTRAYLSPSELKINFPSDLKFMIIARYQLYIQQHLFK